MSDPQGPSGPEPQTRLDFERPAPERAPSGLRLVVDADGIGWILFDAPGEKVNTLSTPVMEALRDALDEAQRRGVKALAFASDKPRMFLAGAAVEEIAGITDPQRGAEKAAYGQAIFEAIAQFPRPTAAVITGPCLGGGYELALACRWCIAENSDAVKVGLPEVRLGILPGFGGTQLLSTLTRRKGRLWAGIYLRANWLEGGDGDAEHPEQGVARDGEQDEHQRGRYAGRAGHLQALGLGVLRGHREESGHRGQRVDDGEQRAGAHQGEVEYLHREESI